jgi:hypothetical protein
MPIVQVSHAPSREQYEQVMRELDLAQSRPAGLLVHAASDVDDGTVEIVDMYRDRDDLIRFEREQLFPLFERLGITPPPGGPPVAREPFSFIS